MLLVKDSGISGEMGVNRKSERSREAKPDFFNEKFRNEKNLIFFLSILSTNMHLTVVKVKKNSC